MWWSNQVPSRERGVQATVAPASTFLRRAHWARSCGEMSSTRRPWLSTSTRFFMRLTNARSWLATSTLVPRSGSDCEQRHDFGRQGRIEVAGGFVGNQQSRFADDRAGDADALLLAGRQLRRQGVGARTEAHLVEHAAHALADLAATHAAQDQRHGDVVGDAAIGQQAMVLEYHADFAPVQRDAPAAHLEQVLFAEQHRAAAGALGQMDQLEQRALAGAGVASDEQHLARRHREADFAQRFMAAAVPLADVVEAQDAHRSPVPSPCSPVSAAAARMARTCDAFPDASRRPVCRTDGVDLCVQALEVAASDGRSST